MYLEFISILIYIHSTYYYLREEKFNIKQMRSLVQKIKIEQLLW